MITKNKKEELIQLFITKAKSVMRNIHTTKDFPLHGLKVHGPQVWIMFILAKHENGISVKDLASVLHVTSGAVSQFLDELFKEGLIEREEDKVDRRSIRIKLSESAKSRFHTFKKNYFERISPIFSNLKDEEIDQLIGLLNKIDTSKDLENCQDID